MGRDRPSERTNVSRPGDLGEVGGKVRVAGDRE